MTGPLGALAHQGGWDEILLPVAAVLLVIAIGARRRRAGNDDEPAEEPAEPPACAYCGEPMGAQDERCPKCGFARA